MKPRELFIDRETTCCWRAIHGAGDGFPGWYVDRLGDFLLSQSDRPLRPDQRRKLDDLLSTASPGAAKGAYHKILNPHVRRADADEICPQYVCGAKAPERFAVMENGVNYELSFREGYSTGLFLDQRENRQRLLANRVAPDFSLFDNGTEGRELLNTFAYTCAFSVCAAKAGFRATSLDLSKKYLDWGRRNFEMNRLDPAAHDFIYGDAFDWMRRLAKKQRRFDAIILDPPTFSQSKEQGVFRAEKDFGRLVSAALPMLSRDGILFASTNAARLSPEAFLRDIRGAISSAGRKIIKHQFAPQPPDFPATAAEPAYLKTVWLRVG